MKFLSLFLLLSGFNYFSHAQDTTAFTKSEIIYGRKDGMALTMVMLAPKNNSNGKELLVL
ncbi:MAG: hypothetical protein WKF59_12850 [Chitinophagaceae bacterium]